MSQSQHKFNHSFAVIIGIDEYSNKIPRLYTAVSDAKKLAEILEGEKKEENKNYENEAHDQYKVLKLIDESANFNGLTSLLEAFKQEKPSITLSNGLTHYIEKDDRLLFYFAGHGLILKDALEDQGDWDGYLVPQDATADVLSETDIEKIKKVLLPMQDLKDAITQLPCRHVLVILDCCFAGAFRSTLSRDIVASKKVFKERYKRFIDSPAWQVITSASHDQKAVDLLGRFGQRGENKHGHSPFAQALFQGLSGKANISSGREDGIITATQLYVHLRDEVEVITTENHSRQTPGIYPFSPKKHDKGEYIFLLPHFNFENLDPAPALKPENNPYRGLSSYEESDAQLFFGRKKLIEELGKLVCNPEQQMTIVIGASGSGKSSLVKAGLIPYLKKSEVGQEWQILTPMRPGESPFGELAKAIFLTKVDFCPSDTVNFITEILKQAQEKKNHSQSENTQDENNKNLAKISVAWDKANLQSRLLLIVDNFKYLENLCKNSQRQQLQELRDTTSSELKKLEQALRKRNTQEIIDILVGVNPNRNNIKIMLVIDQFEELVTLCPPKEQEVFLKFLAQMLNTYPKHLHIILTLRSDFEPQFRESEVKEYWEKPKAKFLVTAMNTEEFRQVITGPAEANMLEFYPPSLVDMLIDEVGQMPGALPLLSFALSELYINCIKQESRTIKEEDYEKMGKVVGSLTQQAEKTYKDVIEKEGVEEQTIRNVMLRMVTVTGGEPTRRRVTKSELEYPGAKNDQVKMLIDCFTEARLLVEGKDTQENIYVEPAHDALVRGWPRLQTWIKEDQENLILQQRLTPAAIDWKKSKKQEKSPNLLSKFEFFWIDLLQEWRRKGKRKKQEESNYNNSNGKSTGYLWNNDPRIDQLNPLVNTDNSWLNKDENDFVKQSVIQRGRITYRVGFIVLIVLLGLTGLTIFALIQRQTAITRQLASQGKLTQTEDNTQLQLGTLLAVESLKWGTLQPLDAVQALHQGIGLLPRFFHSTTSSPPGYLPPYKQGFLNVFAFTSDSKYIAIAKDHGITLKEVVSGKEVGQLKYNQELKSVTLSPDGKYAATVAQDNTITVWDLSNFREIARQTYPQKVNNIVLSPNGKYLAVVSKESEESGEMDREIFEISNNQEFTTVELPKAQVSSIDSIVFSPDGKYVAEYAKNTRKVWDLSSKKEIIVHKANLDSVSEAAPSHERGNDMVFSSDGKYFAAFVGADTAKVWELPSGQKKAPESSTIQIKEAASLNDIALSPDGKYVAIGDQGGNIKIMDVASGKEVAHMKHSSPTWIGKVVFSPDGKHIATVGRANDKLVRVYEVPNSSSCQEKPCTLKEVARMVHETDTVNAVFSPNGKYLATEEDTSQSQKQDTAKVSVNVWEAISTPEVLRTEVSGRLENINFDQTGLEIVAYTEQEKVIKKIVGDVANSQEDIDVQPRNDERDFGIKKQEEFVIDDNPKNKGSKIVKLLGNKEAKPIELTSDFLRMINKVNTIPDNEQLKNYFKVSPKAKYVVGFLPDPGADSSRDTSGFIKVWGASKDKNKEVFFTTLPRAVNRIIFSSDERYLAAVIGDGTARIWDLKTYPPQEVERLQVADGLQEIAFSPDGKYFVTASYDYNQSKGIVQVWLRQPKEMTAEACKRLSRNLTRDEWQQYLGTGNSLIDFFSYKLYQIRPTCPKLGISHIQQKAEISKGNKTLIPTAVNPNKQAGVEALAAGDFETARKHLKTSLSAQLNDPESLIYLNNAQIGNQKSYTIAVSVPISSNINGSLEILRGVAQAQDDFNNWAKTQQGIVPIRILIADDHNDPKVAQEIAKEFANNPDVLGVVGHYASDVTLAAGEIYQSQKLVAISPISTSVNLSKVLGEYVFRTVPSDKIAAIELANYIAEQSEKKKAVVFYNDKNDYSRSMKSEFESAIASQGGQVLKAINLSDPNFNADQVVEDSIQKGAEVLVLMPNTEKLNEAIKVIEANNQRLPLLAGDGMYNPIMLEKVGQQAVNMVVAIPWHIKAHPESNFSRKSKALWGDRDVNWRTAMSYDAAKALMAAIKEKNTRQEIGQFIRSEEFKAQGVMESVQFLSGDRKENIIQLVKIVKPEQKSSSGYDYEFKPVENNSKSKSETQAPSSK